MLFSATRFIRLLLLTGVCFLLLNCCAPPKPFIELPGNYYPLFIDDGDLSPLLSAIDRHLNLLDNQPAETVVEVGGNSFTYGQFLESLETFRDIVSLKLSPFELDERIRRTFNVYQPAATMNGGKNSILLTGYYEPLFEGSLTREGAYQYPLYRVPDTLVTRVDKTTGKKTLGRLTAGGALLPYWSRQEIEQNNLLGGGELVYLKDPFDAYLIHIQGSGRVRLQDGSSRALHFAGSNGRNYKSLGKLFVKEKIMEAKEVSAFSMRKFFQDRPNRLIPMLHHNPRYIFFKWGEDGGPVGSLGEVLTPGRSVAVDHSLYPSGAFGYLVSRRPVLAPNGSISHWKTFSRFVLPQDSGSAIKGTGRVDLFWGAGKYAETAASHMKERGQFYFLVKKQF